jgi:hypothetical protein
MATSTQPPSDDDHNHAVTETQQKILDCYREWVERHGYPLLCGRSPMRSA